MTGRPIASQSQVWKVFIRPIPGQVRASFLRGHEGDPHVVGCREGQQGLPHHFLDRDLLSSTVRRCRPAWSQVSLAFRYYEVL